MNSIEFLKAFHPQDIWTLTFIDPKQTQIGTKSFTFDQRQACEEWIAEHNGMDNLYFNVNPGRKPKDKKLARSDVKSLNYLHVDKDPEPGKDVKAEQERILKLFTEDLPIGVPKPTALIFSGGGYQAFWKLDHHVPLDGSEAMYEEFARYNMQLEIMFKADHCHNIDRIMRLPGTANIPGEKKKAAGRKTTKAKVIWFNPDDVYPLDDFTAAPLVNDIKVAKNTKGSVANVEVDAGNIRRYEVEELSEWNVPDRIKVIIVQGEHPDEVKDDTSRSSWLFDVVCNLVRSGVPDQVIYSIITDKNHYISKSVLDKGSSTHKYALKQIKSAKEFTHEPEFFDLNKQYAKIVNFADKCVVMQEIPAEMNSGRPRTSFLTIDNFCNQHMHRKVKVGVKADGGDLMKPAAKAWLESPLHRSYENVVFDPSGKAPDAVYNMWNGFAYEALPGNCDLFLQHCFDNLCGGNQGHFDYLMGWMATAVQFPARPGKVAPVFRSGQGTGKGFFASTFGRLFGRHYLHITNASHLVGNFNAHLRDCVVLFADEAFFAGDKKHESQLKTLITEDKLAIEAKGMNMVQADNFIHLILASNKDWVVPVDGDDRRFFVLDVSEGQKQNGDYFKAIQDQLDDGGYSALLHTLLNYNLKGFDVTKVPKTKGLADQKQYSMTPEEAWIFEKLLDGTFFDGDDEWPKMVLNRHLMDDYEDFARNYGRFSRGGSIVVGKFLQKLWGDLPKVRRRNVRVKLTGEADERTFDRAIFYKIPSLAFCRSAWTERYGQVDWPEIVEAKLEDIPNQKDENIPF